MVYSTDRSKAVVPVLALLFVALWFVLRGDLFYVLPCVILFLCFSVLLALRLPRLGKRELILVLFVRFFDLCLFGFVGFLFLLVSGKGCGLWLWHSLDFSLTFLCDCGTPWTFLLPFCVIVALPGLFSYLFVWLWHSLDFSLTFLCDCGTPWTFRVPFSFHICRLLYHLFLVSTSFDGSRRLWFVTFGIFWVPSLIFL